jgi:hypothetical protein
LNQTQRTNKQNQKLTTMRTIRLLGGLLTAVLLAAGVTGCASGPQFSALHSTEAPVAAGEGRIYLYRKATMVGAAIQPAIKINGEKVGDAIPGGYCYVDRPAGNYDISATTEVTRSLSLTLESAQVRYVRFNIGMGFFVGHVWPELVENPEAEKEIQHCHFIGKPPETPPLTSVSEK